MYRNKMFTQVLECQKILFDGTFAVMSTLQDQGCRIMDQVLEKNPLLRDNGKEMCSYWVDFVKENRENCKGYVDSSFDRIKMLFEGSETGPAVNDPEKDPGEKSSVKTAEKTA